MPFFSIIIPLFNKENYIENTLKSVLNQSFTDFELIIINDGSTDKSETIVQQFSDSRIHYFSKENEGVSTTRNFGIEKATAPYICFLDADDYWYPDFLEEYHKTIQQHSDYKVFSSAIEIEVANRIFPARYSVSQKEAIQVVNYFESSLKESIIWTSSVVIHKSAFEKIGLFDVGIKYGEDTDLWIRIGLEYPVVFNWKILSRYVYDKDSVSRNEHYIYDVSSITKFENQEKDNKPLRQFLDLNRFSAAIKYKLIGHDTHFKKMYNGIDFKTLGWKKAILLQLPSLVLKKLIALKSFLSQMGLTNSVFK